MQINSFLDCRNRQMPLVKHHQEIPNISGLRPTRLTDNRWVVARNMSGLIISLWARRRREILGVCLVKYPFCRLKPYYKPTKRCWRKLFVFKERAAACGFQRFTISRFCFWRRRLWWLVVWGSRMVCCWRVKFGDWVFNYEVYWFWCVLRGCLSLGF